MDGVLSLSPTTGWAGIGAAVAILSACAGSPPEALPAFTEPLHVSASIGVSASAMGVPGGEPALAGGSLGEHVAVATVTAPVVGTSGPVTAGPSEAPSLRDIAERASRYSVFVRSGSTYGAGVLLDDSGHVITCDHVVPGAEATVQFEGQSAPTVATVLARAPDIDLALLKVRGPLPSHAAPAFAFGVADVTSLQRGDEVFAMGSPRKMTFSFHRGVVSYSGRPFDDAVYVQTDVAMSPGSSGGPILDRAGNLIGIATFVLTKSEGLSFALPLAYALDRFEVLGHDGSVQGWPGQRTAFRDWLQARTGNGAGSSAAQPAAVVGH